MNGGYSSGHQRSRVKVLSGTIGDLQNDRICAHACCKDMHIDLCT